MTDPPATFLAFTKKWGWVVIERTAPAWCNCYETVPGNFTVTDESILQREELPHGRACE